MIGTRQVVSLETTWQFGSVPGETKNAFSYTTHLHVRTYLAPCFSAYVSPSSLCALPALPQPFRHLSPRRCNTMEDCTCLGTKCIHVLFAQKEYVSPPYPKEPGFAALGALLLLLRTGGLAQGRSQNGTLLQMLDSGHSIAPPARQPHFKCSLATCSSWLLQWTAQTENVSTAAEVLGGSAGLEFCGTCIRASMTQWLRIRSQHLLGDRSNGMCTFIPNRWEITVSWGFTLNSHLDPFQAMPHAWRSLATSLCGPFPDPVSSGSGHLPSGN